MINVDYFMGPRIDEQFGAMKNAIKLKENTQGVNFNEITYPVVVNNTKLDFISKIGMYPFIAKAERVEGSIAHLAFQDYAFLYPYVSQKGPVVISCLDLIEKLYYNRDGWHLMRNMNCIPKADAVVTLSEYSKNQIFQFYRGKIPMDNIHVVPCGVDLKVYRPVKSDIREKYQISEDKKIILYVGSEQPRKNFTNLLEVLFMLHREGYENYVLLKVGNSEWKGAREENLGVIGRMDLKLGKDVIFTGFVSEEDLPKYYSGADVFVFLSENEGFGLPPLEAMACGCPVITTNHTSLPEVTGLGALKVNPQDTLAIKEMILNLVERQTQSYRDSWIERGFEQSAKFTWEKAGEKLLEVYQNVS